MVPGMEVLGLRSLAQVIAELKGAEVPEAPPVAPMSGQRLLSWRGQDRHEEVDLADLRGMHDARYAVEVAAAGGHHVMLAGPKGSGKTSLAERISGILPDLASDEALELTAVHSLAGALEPTDDLRVRPPFAAPHHSSSKAALLGGGSGRGAAGRDQPIPLRRVVPRRVPAARRRRHRVATPTARERRGHHRPRRGDRHLPGPRDGRPRGQPVPVRRLRTAARARTAASARRRIGATTSASCRVPSSTAWTSCATSSRSSATRDATPSPSTSRRPRSERA